ncbi:MAG: HupE/UreJ family protein [Myxococcota bacterium]
MRAALAMALLLAATFATPSSAASHARSVSHSFWAVDAGGAEVRLRLSLLDLSALEPVLPGALEGARLGLPTKALTAHLQSRVRMLAGDAPCTAVPGSFRSLEAREGHLRYGWRVRCAGDGPRHIRSDLLMDAVPAHLHFATVRTTGDGGAEVQRVLDPASRTAEVPAAAPSRGAAEVAARHVVIGVEHILGGWDHLVFLFVLLLWAPRWREVIVTVTGFTLGHSVTLALAVLGWASPRATAVEALIGLSIALVAAENVWLAGERRGRAVPAGTVAALLLAAAVAVWAGQVPAAVAAGMAVFAACQFGLLARMPRPGRWRWTVAGVFGLVHGFGFAGALADTRPDPSHLVPALLGFNAGVELGQLALVAVAWPLLAWWSAGADRRRWLVHGGSAAAAAAGVFWYVSRAFG